MELSTAKVLVLHLGVGTTGEDVRRLLAALLALADSHLLASADASTHTSDKDEASPRQQAAAGHAAASHHQGLPPPPSCSPSTAAPAVPGGSRETLSARDVFFSACEVCPRVRARLPSVIGA